MSSKIILLNGGAKTRDTFNRAVRSSKLLCYHSKQMLLHIKEDLSINAIYDNALVDFSDAYVFTRLRATDSHFCGILYEHFASLGIKASDPINRSFKMSDEKISQMPRLARAQIAIPETIIAREESYEANKAYIAEHITFPLVYKTDGSQGRAVFMVKDTEELEHKIKQKKPHELFLLQKYIPNTFDTRTLVAYGKVLGSIKRAAKAGEFLNNVAQGATVEKYELRDEEKEIAIGACRECKVDFGGVDIIHTENGPLVLEVNKSPQFGGFEKIHGKDIVFKTIAEMIENDLV